MLPLVLAVALAQAPVKVAVVQSSNLGVPAKRAADLTRLLIELLGQEKLEPLESKTPCDTPACQVGAGRELGATGVIAVAFASVGKDTVMDLEFRQVSDSKSLAQTTFQVRPQETKLPGEALIFIRDITKQLAAPAPAPVATKPDEVLVPKQTGEPQSVLIEPRERSHAPAFVMGGAAIVAGAVAATFGVIGLNQKTELGRMLPGTMMSPYTYDAAVQLRDTANRNFSVSAGALGVCAALLVAAVVLFVW